MQWHLLCHAVLSFHVRRKVRMGYPDEASAWQAFVKRQAYYCTHQPCGSEFSISHCNFRAPTIQS